MLVETKKQVQEFEQIYKTEDCIIIPIQCDSNKHSVNDELSLLYVQTWGGNEFILPFNHSETLNIEVPNLKSNTKKYTYDIKKLNHFLQIDNVFDVNLLYYIDKGLPLDIEDMNTNAHNYFYTKYYKKNNINKIIPVLKHLEYCRKLASILKDTVNTINDKVNLSYNNDVLRGLGYIEQNGLQTTEGKVYSEYNIYTSTGRPSNRFGGINFAALNKSDGSRKPYVSRFKTGVLVEMDYDAYHLRLIADKIGYDFPDGSVHEYLGKQYGVDYETSKKLSFKYLDRDVVNFEPSLALNGGRDGFSEIIRVVNKTSTLIKKNGLFILEIGYNQKTEVIKMLKTKGFYIKKILKEMVRT